MGISGGGEKSGAAIPRSVLVLRCRRDESFLDVLCSMVSARVVGVTNQDASYALVHKAVCRSP